MGELINGRTPEEIKAALDYCSHDICGDNDECAYLDEEIRCWEKAMKDALEYIKRLEAAQPKWISVEERLPERECLAIGWQHEMLIGNVYRSGAGYACESDGEYLMDVTYWMPLPSAPEGE